MSDVQSRPARGRSSARGGRGGHGARGPRSNKQTNGDHSASPAVDTSADQGELGELKRRYLSQLNTLKEMFPDWTDVDLVLAIEESDGDLPATIERITEGKFRCTRRGSRAASTAVSAPAQSVPLGFGLTNFPHRQCVAVCRSQKDQGPFPLQGGQGGGSRRRCAIYTWTWQSSGRRQRPRWTRTWYRPRPWGLPWWPWRGCKRISQRRCFLNPHERVVRLGCSFSLG